MILVRFYLFCIYFDKDDNFVFIKNFLVKGWLTRETKRGYSIGQFWYLIASDWYQNWQQYTQTVTTSSPCHFCKSMSNNYTTNQRNAIDEAMVCDESFTSNSTESMGDLLAAADSSSLGENCLFFFF